MRINEKNYNNEKIENVSSKLTDEIKTQMLIVTNSSHDILSMKLYDILKREYSIKVTECIQHNPKFEKLVFDDFDYFEAFLRIHNIKVLLFTGELIAEAVSASREDDFRNAFSKICFFCNEKNIKLVFLNITDINISMIETRNTFHLGMIQKYNVLCDSLMKIIRENSYNIIFTISCFYGISDYTSKKDFPQFILDSLKKGLVIECDNYILLDPILADEIALFVGKHIKGQGQIEIHRNSAMVTEYKWAKGIAVAENISSELIKVVRDGRQEEVQEGKSNFRTVEKGKNDFTDIIDGYITEKKQKECIFKLVYKLLPTENFMGENIAGIRMDLGKALAKIYPENFIKEIDCIVPVPKTGIYYAMGMACELGIPYVQALSKDTSEIRSFQYLNSNVRKEIIKNKIIPIGDLLRDKRIIVVDEAIFTGTTLKVICKMLREYGTSVVHVAIPTPACYCQCPYYIQPNRTMLLEYTRVSQLKEYFEADSVIFQKENIFKKEIEKFGNVCMTCFGNMTEER
jgi:adenine/guanine phosphoribosyltransferase-like PRPP-binding protein